jgi:hypothetical protein
MRTRFILSFIPILFCCNSKKIDFVLSDVIVCHDPVEIQATDGFSIFKSESDLTSSIQCVKPFMYLSKQLDIICFDFDHYDYIFTFGRTIKNYNIIDKKWKYGTLIYYIQIEYNEEINSIIYIYSVPKFPRLSPLMG